MTDIDYATRVLDCCGGWIEPREAQLCLQCEAVSKTTERDSPACGSPITTPLLAFLAP